MDSAAPAEGRTATAQSALTNVTWTNTVGVSAAGNSLTKSSNVADWNAGASSNETISCDGYIEFTTSEANTNKMAGLSNGDTDTSYGDIDYAFYMSDAGALYLYEDGAFVQGVYGSYVAGDVLRIQHQGGVVTYWQNGSLMYTSSRLPTLPLLVDTSLFTPGATISNAVLSDGLPIWTNASGVSVSGNLLTKTGTAGWSAGASSTAALATNNGYVEFTTNEANAAKMVGLSNGDTDTTFADIDFAFYLTASGTVAIYEDGTFRATGGTYAAGDVFRVELDAGVVRYLKNGAALYTSSSTPTLPLLVDTSLYSPGATVANVTFTPTLQDLTGVASSCFTLTKTGAAGWDAGASSAASFVGDGYVEFRATETNTDRMAGLSSGDSDATFGDIDYGVLLSSGGSAWAYEQGVYKMGLGTYASGDVFRVQVQGGGVSYLLNGAVVYTSTTAPGSPLNFDSSFYTPGSTLAAVNVASLPPSYWVNVSGVSAAGSTLTKIGPMGWNAGASSAHSVDSPFTGAQFTTAEADTDKMIGLGFGDSDTGYADIDYAFYLSSSGAVSVYEAGAYRGTFGTYSAGDTFTLLITSDGHMEYQQFHQGNGLWSYIGGTVPSGALVVDTSLFTPGASVQVLSFTP